MSEKGSAMARVNMHKITHEDNQPTETAHELVKKTIGCKERVMLDEIPMKNGGTYRGEWKDGTQYLIIFK